MRKRTKVYASRVVQVHDQHAELGRVSHGAGDQICATHIVIPLDEVETSFYIHRAVVGARELSEGITKAPMVSFQSLAAHTLKQGSPQRRAAKAIVAAIIHLYIGAG
jgi:hypothetical protein